MSRIKENIFTSQEKIVHAEKEFILGAEFMQVSS